MQLIKSEDLFVLFIVVQQVFIMSSIHNFVPLGSVSGVFIKFKDRTEKMSKLPRNIIVVNVIPVIRLWYAREGWI